MNARAAIRWLLVLLILACGLPAAPPAAARESPYAWIAEAVARTRGLQPLEEVQETYLSREEYRARLEASSQDETAQEIVLGLTRTLEAFGMIPEGVDLRSEAVEELSSDILGYYDVDANEMVLISESGEPDAWAQLTYAHEYVHALQDQHFDLLTLTESIEALDDSEAMLGLETLVEGDATVVQMIFMVEHPDLLDEFMSDIKLQDDTTSTGTNAASWIVSDLINFPYFVGLEFVSTLLQNGGWDAVNAAYADPPASAEQVLHPERYLERDEPTPVAPPDLGGMLGEPWERVDRDIMGEFALLLLFGQEALAGHSGLDVGFPDVATVPADGWDGDRYETWANGEQTVLVWRSAWDSAADTVEFVAALRNHDAARWDAEPVERDGVIAIDGDGWSSRILLRGTIVDYALATTPELADQALAAMSDEKLLKSGDAGAFTAE